MSDIIEIILLILIAWFIVSTKGGFSMLPFGKRRKIILDSCALIDGRIVEVVNSRFISDDLVIPQFIVNELQMLADGNDSHKRERARFGLDIAHQLQDAAPVTVVIDRSVFPEVKVNDDKLILLAKKLNAVLCTTDYNLGKVAAVESVHVLNVNELAQSLRPVALPGETLRIKIIQKGSSRDQGVGYLDDGTMIVVDNAARYINKVMPVTVTRMHQTVAGKMVFGQIRDEQHSELTPAPKNDRASQESTGRSMSIEAAAAPVRQSAGSAGARNAQKASPSTSPAPNSPQGKLHSRLQRPFKRKRAIIS